MGKTNCIYWERHRELAEVWWYRLIDSGSWELWVLRTIDQKEFQVSSACRAIWKTKNTQVWKNNLKSKGYYKKINWSSGGIPRTSWERGPFRFAKKTKGVHAKGPEKYQESCWERGFRLKDCDYYVGKPIDQKSSRVLNYKVMIVDQRSSC